MKSRSAMVVLASVSAALCGALWVRAQDKPPAKPEAKAPAKAPAGESEREVKEAEVPPAALATLKKMAGGAAFTEFAEEIEHGHKFYEGSWKGPDGNVDGLVTESGDMVELEESVPADRVPAAARAAAEKEAGKDAKTRWEKKTYVMYEVHFKKDGKGHEMIFTPDGRTFHEEQDGDEDEKGEGEKDDD